MCLAMPAKVLSIDGDEAEVDFGGAIRRTNVSMVDAKVGEYVIIHAGFAIQKWTRRRLSRPYSCGASSWAGPRRPRHQTFMPYPLPL